VPLLTELILESEPKHYNHAAPNGALAPYPRREFDKVEDKTADKGSGGEWKGP